MNTLKLSVTSIVLCLAVFSAFAQADRSNNWIARINYNQNFKTMGYSDDKWNWPIGGLSVDFGGKQFFNPGNGWFIEESVEGFFSYLPNSKRTLDGKWAREAGIGTVLMGGYDFIIDKDLSLDVFGGIVYRYILYDKVKHKLADGISTIHGTHLQPNNLRLKFGAGLNYGKYNFSFSLSPDLINRFRNDWIEGSLGPTYHYTTLQVALGFGIYF